MRTILMLWLAASFANTTTSEYVDSIEPLLKLNRDNFLSGPATTDRQAAALAYFDQQWALLQSGAGCGDKILKSAGARCIADRSRSGPWPWEKYYRDPILFAKLTHQ